MDHNLSSFQYVHFLTVSSLRSLLITLASATLDLNCMFSKRQSVGLNRDNDIAMIQSTRK